MTEFMMWCAVIAAVLSMSLSLASGTILFYIAGINIISFLIFIFDKWCAGKHFERIPENFLLFLCFLGGGTGALIAMVFFRHKIRKKKI